MGPGAHLFWITSRAAGFTALITASLSVGVGIASMPRTGLSWGRRADMRPLHEALGLTTLAAIAIHGLALLGDGYLHPGIVGIAVPFAGSYRPLWTGLGIIGGYGLMALGLSYYARARIGIRRWRLLHRFTVVFWAAAIVHSLAGGTDSGEVWFLALAVLVLGPAGGMVTARIAALLAERRSRPDGIDLPTLGRPHRDLTE
jgi:methionine sulfoxide reductase heme-binding subunit